MKNASRPFVKYTIKCIEYGRPIHADLNLNNIGLNV